MWTIGQLKERGRTSFKRNYWKCVLVALILSVITTGGGGSAATAVSSAFTSAAESLESRVDNFFIHTNNKRINNKIMSRSLHDGVHHTYRDVVSSDDFEDYLERYLNEYDENDFDDFYYDFDGDYDYDYFLDDDDDYYWDDDYYYDDYYYEDDFFEGPAFWAFFAVFMVLFIIVFIIVLALSIVLDIFILNPIGMGMNRFFFKNLAQAADVKEVAYGFDHSYKNVIATLFFKDLYTCLWTLLFIIPGIIKSYEYRMIPYILSEYPNMPREQAFATSKQMMMGEKWRAFVLDLSFVGWRILDAFTAGILGIFYVNPYYQSTCAALYETLKYQKGTVSTGYQGENQNPVNYVPAETPATMTPSGTTDTIVSDQDMFEEE